MQFEFSVATNGCNIDAYEKHFYFDPKLDRCDIFQKKFCVVKNPIGIYQSGSFSPNISQLGVLLTTSTTPS
jgi:hypothetical protein